MPEDRSETYQLQTSQGKWAGGLPVQKGHATIGGKVYPTVKMPDGSVWMAQNLDMTWYGLTTITDYTLYTGTPKCAYWQFDQTTYEDRGLFYNEPAVRYLVNNNATLCPGWHVPDPGEISGWWNLIYPSSISDRYGFNLSVYGHGRIRSSDDTKGWYTAPTSADNDSLGYCVSYIARSSNTLGYYYVKTTEDSIARSFAFVYHSEVLPVRLVMDDPSQFVPDTTENKNTRVQYTKYWRPWVVIEFSDSSFEPTWNLTSGVSDRRYNATWERVSTSPNRWKCTVQSCSNVGNTGSGYGLAFLFTAIATDPYDPVLIPANMNNGTCKIVDWGNLDNTETMDRFAKANTGITQIPSTISFGSYITNVNEMFAGCTEVSGGALALYNVMKDNPTIANHADTFKNCGVNSQTGLAELQQIPLSWGGLLMPPSTTMACTRVESKNPKVKWSCGSTAPDWSAEPELYVFTTSSVSQYAGVNMRKTSIVNTQNGLDTSSAATYYRVAFVQFASGTSGAITWVLTTTGYNGTLSASQSAGDMPGTLSYDNFGPTDKHYGTYDSSKTVYMAFLVTNVAPDNWGGLTDAYGLQGNNFFLTPIEVKWFTA